LEIELPQSEHLLVSLFLELGFRVAALRERYWPGQSVCVLERTIGGTYCSDPFDLIKLGKWLVRAIFPCRLNEINECKLDNGEKVPVLSFEGHPSTPAFSSRNPIGHQKRLRGAMAILDEGECTESNIEGILRSGLLNEGQLRYILAHELSPPLRSQLESAGVTFFELPELREIAGGELSSLSIPMDRAEVGGILTVLEQERIREYAQHKDQFIYYLLSGIGSALDAPHADGNTGDPSTLLAVYCPSWHDGRSGIVAVSEVDEIANVPFDSAFDYYPADIPRALTKEDLAFYRTRSDKDRLYVLKCSPLRVLEARLGLDDLALNPEHTVRDYLARELRETNSVYLNYGTCDILRHHLSRRELPPAKTAHLDAAGDENHPHHGVPTLLQRPGDTQVHSHTQEHIMDPVSVMTAISSSLGLVDKFVNLIKKLKPTQTQDSRLEAKKEDEALVIRRDGKVVRRVATHELQLNEWDSARFTALDKRVKSHWQQFNGLYGQLPNLAVDEQVRVKQRMEEMRQELCQDFREMVSISEKVLGVSLEDHYSLETICRDGIS
jgi:hypothetical protein